MKHAHKYYPGSPALQIIGKLLGAEQGGHLTDVGASKVFLTLDHGDHLQRWKNYRRDTVSALADDELVTLEPVDEAGRGQITLTEAGHTLWNTVMSR